MRERVIAARERQRRRTGGDRANADLAAEEIEIGAEVERLLADVTTAGGLNGRGRERVIRLARTLADLDRAASIAVEHFESPDPAPEGGAVSGSTPWVIERGAPDYPECLADLDPPSGRYSTSPASRAQSPRSTTRRW